MKRTKAQRGEHRELRKIGREAAQGTQGDRQGSSSEAF